VSEKHSWRVKGYEVWHLVLETEPGRIYELISPPLSGAPADSAMLGNYTAALYDTGWASTSSYTGLHVTANAACLLDVDYDHRYAGAGASAAAVLRLLLVWDQFHDQLRKLFSQRSATAIYCKSFSASFPELYEAVARDWETLTIAQAEELLQAHSQDLFTHKRSSDFVGRRDGYRNMPVNVCKFLDVDCCQECDKNEKAKWSGVEFRIFDTRFGEAMRLIVVFVQALVGKLCDLRAKGQLAEALPAPSGTGAGGAEPLFAWLGLEWEPFRRVFVETAHGKEVGKKRRGSR